MNQLENSTRPERLYGTRIDGLFSVSGIVHVIRNEAELPYIREGEIIVANRIDPDWKDQLALAKAFIEDASAVDSVSETLAEQYDIPAVAGVKGAMDLRSGDIVTIYGDGEIERVFEKRAPDSPMRVSVPAAVAARSGHGIITAENVVPFTRPKGDLQDDGLQDTDNSQEGDNHSPASGE